MMKRLFQAVLFIVACLVCSPAWSIPSHKGATCLIGGADGCLDAYNGGGLSDGDVASVFVGDGTGGFVYHYRLDADSGLAEDGFTVIAPDTNAGDKRWIRLLGYEVYHNATLNATTVESTFGNIDYLNATEANASDAYFSRFRGDWITYNYFDIPVGALVPPTTGAATVDTHESNASSKVAWDYGEFNATSGDHGTLALAYPLPEDCDPDSGFKAKFWWMPNGTAGASGTVEFNLSAFSAGDGESVNGTAFGSMASVTDAVQGHETQHITGATGSLTISGSPAAGHMVYWRLDRNGTGSDTMDGDYTAYVQFVRIQYRQSRTRTAY